VKAIPFKTFSSINQLIRLFSCLLLILALQGCGHKNETSNSQKTNPASAETFDEKLARANRGDAQAQDQVGVYYFAQKNDVEAVKWFRKAAEQGFAGGQCSLGLCYDEGFGVTQDYAEAVKWYRKAADQEDAAAQQKLGYCYGNGNGVEKDFAEAVKWWRKAADHGDAIAQNGLGECYQSGLWGLQPDITEAIKLYRKAAEQGHIYAQNHLGDIYNQGLGHVDETSNYEKYDVNAPIGDQHNGEVLAALLKRTKNDHIEAVRWYRRAANQGYARAVDNLGICYYKGDGVPQSYLEAYVCFSESCIITHQDKKYVNMQRRDETATHLSIDDVLDGRSRAAAFVPKKENEALLPN
jgi:TPR repeat protein